MCAVITVKSQTINVGFSYTIDTTNLDSEMLSALEHHVDLTIDQSAIATSNFRVGLGFEQGNEAFFSREFDTGQQGPTADGCALIDSSGNWFIRLGPFSGFNEVHVTITPLPIGGGEGTKIHKHHAP